MLDRFANALSMTQIFIESEYPDQPVTRTQIEAAVAQMLAILRYSPAEADPEKLIRELESRFNVFVGRESVLSNDGDHLAWLVPELKQSWRYWKRYRQLLERQWPLSSIRALDETTDRILEQLEAPSRPDGWDRRGLVVGHVQSGKTANYTGLICKAADAGYKVIIVLAGIHSNLRSQTQIRLDEGFLGYQSATPGEVRKKGYHSVGVGQIDPSPDLRPDSVTHRLETGDFKKSVADNFNIHAGGGRPLLFVIKKNARVLRNLLEWVHWSAGRKDDSERHKVIENTPLLLVDDEADNASVNTRDGAFDEHGKPDPDHDPTAINKAIRQLLIAFEKRAYVGYTATPFANIFIHEDGETAEAGRDLFPRSFILNVPAPSNYAGPVRIFGLSDVPDEERRVPALGLVRHVDDFEAPDSTPKNRKGWMPNAHSAGHVPRYNGSDEIPPSLTEAMRSFVLVCAARRARGQTRAFNSMLIHVTRFTAIQAIVKRQVEAALENLKLRLLYGEGSASKTVLEALQSLWNRDFAFTTSRVRTLTADSSLSDIDWDEIKPHLIPAIDGVAVREINGKAGDILEYDQRKETGWSVIAVGGDKLARGLTLEGLSVSYFLRASRMYDTLMQMGRWFGYRPGYLDLCRLYCTPDLEDWYEEITSAAEELREEFERMVKAGGIPADYGLKVRAHPALMVTSSVKMRHGEKVQISFAGNISESVAYHRTELELRRNFEALERLINELGAPEPLPISNAASETLTLTFENALRWQSVPAERILDFFTRLKTHPAAPRSSAGLLRQYITEMNRVDELTTWTVGLFPGSQMEYPIGKHVVSLVKRQRRETYTDRYSIRRLLSPKDESIDLLPDELEAAWERTVRRHEEQLGEDPTRKAPTIPAGIFARDARSPKRGLLLLYPLSWTDDDGNLVDVPIPVVGFGVSFPGSRFARPVTYMVNNVYYHQELMGASDE